MNQGLKSQSIQALQDKVLITIHTPKVTFTKQKNHSFYVPRDSSIYYLRSFLTSRMKINSKDSFFLFAYGSILNNHQKIGELQMKFKHKINSQNGLELQLAQMSTFGYQFKRN